MKKKDKYIMSAIGIFGVLFGRILIGVLSEYFGYNGPVIAMSVAVVIVLGGILVLVAKGHYQVAIIFLVMSIPLIVGGIAIYLDNAILVGFSLLLFFIIQLIIIKFVPKLKRDR